jgi:hypothetical protein
MCEAVVYENGTGKRKDLGLVLQPTKRRRENQAVVVALKLRALVVALRVSQLLPEAFV